MNRTGEKQLPYEHISDVVQIFPKTNCGLKLEFQLKRSQSEQLKFIFGNMFVLSISILMNGEFKRNKFDLVPIK